MSTGTVTIPPGNAFTPVGLAVAAGTVIANQSPTAAVWLADGPSVSPGNGIPVQPLGSVTWAQDAPCYAVVDTGVLEHVQLLVTDTVSTVTDPVSLAVAVAAKLLAQQQPVAVQNSPTVQLAAGTEVDLSAGTQVVLANGSTVSLAAGTAVDLAHPVALATGSQVAVNGGTLTGISNAIPVQKHAVSTLDSIGTTVNVAGIVQTEQMAQVTQLATMTFTCPTTGVVPTGTYDLTVSGLNKYASVLVLLQTMSAGPYPTLGQGSVLVGQFLWSPGAIGIETNAAWNLSQMSTQTDYIQLPTLSDKLELTFTPAVAPNVAVTYRATIFGSNLYIPGIRYSNGGGTCQDPLFPYIVKATGSSMGVQYPPSTNGDMALLVRANSSGITAHVNLQNQNPFGGSPSDTVYSATVSTTSVGTSIDRIPGQLAPWSLGISIGTQAGSGFNVTTISEGI